MMKWWGRREEVPDQKCQNRNVRFCFSLPRFFFSTYFSTRKQSEHNFKTKAILGHALTLNESVRTHTTFKWLLVCCSQFGCYLGEKGQFFIQPCRKKVRNIVSLSRTFFSVDITCSSVSYFNKNKKFKFPPSFSFSPEIGLSFWATVTYNDVREND